MFSGAEIGLIGNWPVNFDAFAVHMYHGLVILGGLVSLWALKRNQK